MNTMTTFSLSALPGFAALVVEAISVTNTLITVTACAQSSTALCPACAQTAQQVHSTARRRLRDVPLSSVPVALTLRVRRFFCRTPTCPRRTFTEQIAGVTQPHAQSTIAFNTAVQQLGLAVGGVGGARLGARLGYRRSASTVLRQVLRCPVPAGPPPRVIGLDDWAWRKGRRYGTIIVDLERHAVVELLREHTAAHITAWLQQHPSVEVITRDRDTLYAPAIAAGAPQARQVADRFHLVQNLSKALQEVVAGQSAALREAAVHLTPAPPREVRSAALPALLPDLPALERRAAPTARGATLFATAKELQAQGWSIRRIAKELQVNRRTATRYLRAVDVPRRVLSPQNTTRLRPYLPALYARWAAGVHSGPQLLAELQAQGYTGSLSSLYRALKPLRLAAGPPLPPAAVAAAVRIRSPREATWLLLRHQEDLDADDAAYRAALCACSPRLATATALAHRFLSLLRERQVDALDGWLAAARASGITKLRNFARSLRRDYAAVRAALTNPFSQGQTEGQVNRVKLTKRSGYGRMGFALLRQRILCAA
jgi:transposase